MSDNGKRVEDAFSGLKTAQQVGFNYADKVIPGLKSTGAKFIGAPGKLAQSAYDIGTSVKEEGTLQAVCTNIAQHAAGAT